MTFGRRAQNGRREKDERRAASCATRRGGSSASPPVTEPFSNSAVVSPDGTTALVNVMYVMPFAELPDNWRRRVQRARELEGRIARVDLDFGVVDL